MIKNLIFDIAYDNIELSTALTRAKLIASKVNNASFYDWLKKEIEGYSEDEVIPDYRIIPSKVFVVAEFPLKNILEQEVLIPDFYGQDVKDKTYYYDVIGPINTIIDNIKSIEGPTGRVYLTAEQVNVYSKIYKTNQNYVIRSAYRMIGKVHLKNIIELTKQKLIDILMDLDKDFPNLESDFENTKANNDRVQNIVNNNIFGSNNSMNSATGTNITISSTNSNTLNEKHRDELKEIGVQESEINDLNDIVSDGNKNPSEFSKILNNWLISATAGLASRGIYEQIPKLIQFVHQFM